MLPSPDARSHSKNTLQSIVARTLGLAWTIPAHQVAQRSGSGSKTRYNRLYATIYHAPLVCIPMDRIDRSTSQYRPIVGRVLRVAIHCFDSRATLGTSKTTDPKTTEKMFSTENIFTENLFSRQNFPTFLRIQNRFRELRRGRGRARLRTCRSQK